ncbi:MAG TPA: hypothetical protein VH413_16375 [Verrucomicrobiae bacterium]|nr:hypothetical protein [Verrucomicrobiae bacterium]
MSNNEAAFEEWWNRAGRFYDPDTSDVPWEDKRKALAELAFDTATAQSRNYTADKEQNPTQVEFSNGRVVGVSNGILVVRLKS